MSEPPSASSRGVGESRERAHPRTVGPYRILEPIGEGGFGVVYLAEQTEPVRRRVALKLIKPGMDSASVIARFEAEQQALAVMDHPCIAKVFDAGTTDDGHPYFVMEHVKGEPITTFCDRVRLSVNDRIRLMIRVCEAVQHAHNKGVIHRDLKPSNVLVVHDLHDEPTPRIIDFGVAKALNARLSRHTIFTHQGQLIGTPEYMSPEQAEMSGLDVDTRADVYSLGALLYEILTGALPFDTSLLRSVPLPEIQRILCTVDPPKPSTKIESLAGTKRGGGREPGERASPSELPTRPVEPGALYPVPDTMSPRHAPSHLSRATDPDVIANRRRTSYHALRRMLSQDLDWIVMKCLAKERARRYETASALAQDLHRHLDNEPVLAGPPSVTYRLGKFVRRHRAGAVAAIVVAVVMVAATAVSIGFAVSESKQRQLANEERAEAQRQTEMATQTRDFLIEEIFVKAAPEFLGPDTPALQLVEAASSALWSMDEIDPELRAALNHDMAEIFLRMEKPALAEPHARSAYKWRSDHSEPEDVHLLESMNNLALVCRKLGKYEEADALYEVLLARLEKAPRMDPVSVSQAQHNLAVDKRKLGDFEAADRLSAAALEIRTRLLGDTDPLTLNTLNSRANLLRDMGKLEEAEALCRRALAARRSLFGDEHSHTINSILALGRIIALQGRHEEAIGLYAEYLPRAERTFGSDAIPVAIFRREMGQSLAALGRVEEAEGQLLRAHTIAEARLGETSPKLLEYIHPLIAFYESGGRFGERDTWRTRRDAIAMSSGDEN